MVPSVAGSGDVPRLWLAQLPPRLSSRPHTKLIPYKLYYWTQGFFLESPKFGYFEGCRFFTTRDFGQKKALFKKTPESRSLKTWFLEQFSGAGPLMAKTERVGDAKPNI